MHIGLRHKIMGVSFIIFLIASLVISLVITEGFKVVNQQMLIQNLVHQSDLCVISIRQNLLDLEDSAKQESEFSARSMQFATRLTDETGLRVILFSPTRKLLADSGPGGPIPSDIELSTVLQGNRAYVYRSEITGRSLYFSFPVIVGKRIIGSVTLVYPLVEMDRMYGNIRSLVLVALCSGAVIILMVGTLLSIGITRPILRLKETAVRMAEGDFTGEPLSNTHDEVGALSAAFHIMAREIQNKIADIDAERLKLNAVLESMGEGVVALDAAGKLLTMNTKARTLASEKLQASMQDVFEKIQEQQTRIVVEVTVEDKNILLCGTPLKTSEGTGAVVILNDITELRLLQEKQQQFVASVSHELRTPLTTVVGYIDLLKEHGQQKEIFDTAVHHLEDASERLLRLINDLIDLSCLARYEFEIHPKSVDMEQLLQEIIAQMSLKAQKFNIRIHPSLSHSPPILADASRMQQALVNLLDNAIKYSPGGDIYVTLSQEGAHLIIQIRDTGCGIPSQDLERIFEPFYRVDKARTRTMGGNGLGLSITKEIIEKHKGQIQLESVEGSGTTVTLRLPARSVS